MKIVVLGLWHLGSVTAACCAKHFRVVGLDFDASTVEKLNGGKSPIYEPGLDEIIGQRLTERSLSFTTDAATCVNADVLWFCSDTPVDNNDESDVDQVLSDLRRALQHLPNGALVLISSQLPVGTCRRLEEEFPQFQFACSPENLRLGKAIEAFEKPDRVLVGTRTDATHALIGELFKPFVAQPIFMRTESAEMVKHALNSFLAVSITFINEIARLCEFTGADAEEVTVGLKSDPRIGSRAYLKPGEAFAGGTLARDVVTLTHLGTAAGERLSVIPAIKDSNDHHRSWTLRRLQKSLGDLRGKVIAVLGLTYKPHTDTLRRSAAVELIGSLLTEGAIIHTFDPAVKALPSVLQSVWLAPSVAEAVQGSDAVAICTEWPAFRGVSWNEIVKTMRGRVFVDANGFLAKELKSIDGVEQFRVGRQ